MRKNNNLSIPNSPVEGRELEGIPGESTTPPAPPQKPRGGLISKRQKPQISSIPGISPKERNRYRVMLGEEILGKRLTIDQALQVVKGGTR